MTEQYGQTATNIQQAIPVSFSTPDATPVLIDLYTLTEDGQSATIFLEGGGEDPSAPGVNNFTVDAFVTFTRDGGIVTAGAFAFFATNNGAPLFAGFIATGNLCQLAMTGPAFLYEYRFLMSLTTF